MKLVTQNSVNAFYVGKPGKFGKNTQVTVDDCNVVRLFLFGNLIAKKTMLGTYIQTAGWQSNTTKERLNALIGVQINQKNFEWFLNGELWDGKWKQI